MAEPSAVWVYAVLSGPGPADRRELTGVAGEPVRLVRQADLAAAVGTLPPELAGEPQLRQRLLDPGWLEPAVRRHHQVVSELFRRATAVPFRLATVYRGDERVRELLDASGPALREALGTAYGRAEWGIRAYARPGRAIAGATVPAPAPADPSGTAYLRRKQAELAGRESSRAAAAAQAGRLEAALRPLAVAIRRLPAGGAATPGRAAPVTNASYLVAHECAREFVDRAQRLQRGLPQLRVRLTGPWPPYSFVELGAVPA